MTNTNVIGEGSYGCVHKPQLFCDGTSKRKKSKISKLMSTIDATAEMKEYVLIDNADRALNYYLGKPTQCKVDNYFGNRNAIKDCKKIGAKALANMPDYSLLIMEDGGVNLDTFADDVAGWTNTPANRTKIEGFWLEVHRLLVGLKVFLDNDIIHHDLKHQNIVYNETNNRLNFIDFGLMGSKTKILASAKRDDHWLGHAHWSFPWEMTYINKAEYTDIAVLSRPSRIAYLADIVKGVSNNSQDKLPKSIKSFFSTINNSNSVSSRLQHLQSLIDDFMKTILFDIVPGGYAVFAEKCVNTIDSYGVGMALNVVLLSCTYLLDRPLLIDLTNLCVNMCNPSLTERYDVEQALIDYEDIMDRHGLLTKFNKHFENHKLVNGPVIPVRLVNAVADAVDNVKNLILSPAELEVVAVSPVRDCGADKDLNPTTKRCVKKCESWQTRNANFKCRIKTAPKFPPGLVIPKNCGADKDLNPTTKRCVKKCESWQTRNANFKCRIGKAPKFPPGLVIPNNCGAGKELNPTTKRCVKTCKAGYNRDANFKCKKVRVNTVKQCGAGKELNPTTKRCVKTCKAGYTRNADFKCVHIA